MAYFFTSLKGFIQFDEIPYLMKYLKGDGADQYYYSMSLLSISLLIVSIAGILISTFIMMFPSFVRTRLQRLIDFTTTTPELVIIFLLQYVAIYAYKTFDIKLFRLYGTVHNEPYFVPIIIITFLPTIFLIQFLIKEYIKEEQREYVLFARAKGIPLWTIYVKHMIRNIFPYFLIHLRTIIWFLLTNVFVVENLFNMQGIKGVQQYMFRERGMDFILELMLFTIPILLANVLAKLATLSIKRKG
jgi:ABC-type dipeptide/oligopeptide/nickel transport system permease component